MTGGAEAAGAAGAMAVGGRTAVASGSDAVVGVTKVTAAWTLEAMHHPDHLYF